MGRRTRTRLPSNKALLVPKFDTAKIKPALQERQQKQKLYYDRNAKPLEPLKQGDNVKMRDEDKKVYGCLPQLRELMKNHDPIQSQVNQEENTGGTGEI
jgi:hypothetical protein